ncbi:MAG: hypothetical protein OHK006_11410 [Thermodesulfovibrionales bacterium]
MRFSFAVVCALSLLLLAGCNGSSTRKTYFERIDIQDRLSIQQGRIDQGLASGELTLEEAAVARENLEWIRSEYVRVNADGRFTGHERDGIEQLLDANSAMIRDKKQNPVRRLKP